MCLRLLSARHTLFLFLLCGCCAPEYTDTCFLSPFLLVTLVDTMCSLDVSHVARNRWTSHHVTLDISTSRASGLLTRTFPVSVSRDSYCTCMCHGDPPGPCFVMLTFSRLCFLLISGCDDSSLSRFFLHPVLYPTTLPLVH